MKQKRLCYLQKPFFLKSRTMSSGIPLWSLKFITEELLKIIMLLILIINNLEYFAWISLTSSLPKKRGVSSLGWGIVWWLARHMVCSIRTILDATEGSSKIPTHISRSNLAHKHFLNLTNHSINDFPFYKWNLKRNYECHQALPCQWHPRCHRNTRTWKVRQIHGD